MQRIYKYPLEGPGMNVLQMPEGARILSVQTQRDTPTIWALVDTSAPMQHRWFFVIGTGHDAPEYLGTLTFLGTVQMAGGSLVWHVFDGGSQESA